MSPRPWRPAHPMDRLYVYSEPVMLMAFPKCLRMQLEFPKKNHTWVRVQIPYSENYYKLQVTNSKTTCVKVLEYLILTVLKYLLILNISSNMH